MDRLVALYKTWDGHEFIEASLSSIYESVESIVLVHSDVSWLGERGNTVRAMAKQWSLEHDRDGKVHHIDTDVAAQESQYAMGVEYIARHDLGNVAMVVDADEVWEPKHIERARRWMREHQSPAYRSRMHTYLKTPFYRVHPPQGWPTVFVRDLSLLTTSPRACRAKAIRMTDVWMHHYTYVRETRESVERKVRQSALADGGESVIDGWMESVYDRLPEGENLHAFSKWREMWKCVEKVWTPEVPEPLRNSWLMALWLPPGEMNDGEMHALHRLAKGRTQAVDLGTHHGRSAAVLSLACARCHTVDCYDALPEGTFADTLDPSRYESWRGANTLPATQALAKRLGNMTCEQSLTADAGRNWSGGPVDVLFVDADHSEEAVLADVRAWAPHLRTGSRIVFHDDNDLHPGVQSAIRILMGSGGFETVDPGQYSGSIAAMDVR